MENAKKEEEKRKSVEEVSEEEEMLLLDGEMEVEETGKHEITLKASMDMFWQEPSTGPKKVPSDDEAGSDMSEKRPKKEPSEEIVVTNTINEETEQTDQLAKMSQKVTPSGSTVKERIDQESEEEKAEKKAKEEEEQKVREEEEKRREDLIEELGSAVKFIGQQGPISITEYEMKQLIFLGKKGLPYVKNRVTEKVYNAWFTILYVINHVCSLLENDKIFWAAAYWEHHLRWGYGTKIWNTIGLDVKPTRYSLIEDRYCTSIWEHLEKGKRLLQRPYNWMDLVKTKKIETDTKSVNSKPSDRSRGERQTEKPTTSGNKTESGKNQRTTSSQFNPFQPQVAETADKKSSAEIRTALAKARTANMEEESRLKRKAESLKRELEETNKRRSDQSEKGKREEERIREQLSRAVRREEEEVERRKREEKRREDERRKVRELEAGRRKIIAGKRLAEAGESSGSEKTESNNSRNVSSSKKLADRIREAASKRKAGSSSSDDHLGSRKIEIKVVSPKIRGIEQKLGQLQKIRPDTNKEEGLNLLTISGWTKEGLEQKVLPYFPTCMGVRSSWANNFLLFDPATLPTRDLDEVRRKLCLSVTEELNGKVKNIEECGRALERLGLQIEKIALELIDALRSTNEKFDGVKYNEEFAREQNNSHRKSTVYFYIRNRAGEFHRAIESWTEGMGDVVSEEEFVEYEDVVQDAVEGILARLWWIHNLEKGVDDKTPLLKSQY